MLINIIYHKTKVPYVVRPMRVENVSVIGANMLVRDGLLLSQVVNVNQFGSPELMITTRRLRPTQVVNANVIGGNEVRVSLRYLAQTQVVNTNAVGSPTISTSKVLQQTRVVNTNVIGDPVLLITKRYLLLTQVVNSNVIGANQVSSTALPSAFVPGETESWLVNDVERGNSAFVDGALKNA